MKNLAQEARRRRVEAIAAITRLDRNIFETRGGSSRQSAGTMTASKGSDAVVGLSRVHAA